MPGQKREARLRAGCLGHARFMAPALAIVTDVGWDTVDAAVVLTNDTDADGEGVWS
jgi:hypothetical protein